MGCFDTVIIDCPSCQKQVSLQTKAGRCNFETFTRLSQIPASIAGDLATETTQCEHCQAEIQFDVQFLVRPMLKARRDEDDDEDDF